MIHSHIYVWSRKARQLRSADSNHSFIAVKTDFNYSNSQSHTCIQDTSLTQDQGSASQKYIFSEQKFEVWPVSGGTANVIDTDEQVKVCGNREFQNSDQIQTHLHCKFWSDSEKYLVYSSAFLQGIVACKQASCVYLLTRNFDHYWVPSNLL